MINSLYYGADTPPALDLSISSETMRRALQTIYQEDFGGGDIEPELFRAVFGPLSSAIDDAFPEIPERDEDFVNALRHSAEVFSAFKVHRAQSDMRDRLLDSNGDLKPFEQWSREVMPIASHQFGPWLRTEYDTAVIRAQNAADWRRFERYRDVLPNLRWVPSTSVNPGADHLPYWGTVLPIDHPFWSRHHPGDRWNCKCSLEATDEEPTGVPENPDAKPLQPQPGLRGNPGKSGNLFDRSHPYFPDSCSECPFNSGFKNRVTTLFNKQKDCCKCQKVEKAIKSSLPPEEGYTTITTSKGRLRIHEEHGEDEKEENIWTGTYLAEKYGEEIDLIPNPNNEKSADSFNRTRGIYQEYKMASTTKTSIDNRLRDGAKQASHIVLRVDSDIDYNILTRGIRGRVNNTRSIEEVIVIVGQKDVILSREQILSKGFNLQQEDFK